MKALLTIITLSTVLLVGCISTKDLTNEEIQTKLSHLENEYSTKGTRNKSKPESAKVETKEEAEPTQEIAESAPPSANPALSEEAAPEPAKEVAAAVEPVKEPIPEPPAPEPEKIAQNEPEPTADDEYQKGYKAGFVYGYEGKEATQVIDDPVYREGFREGQEDGAKSKLEAWKKVFEETQQEINKMKDLLKEQHPAAENRE
jgi:hypothetical protein